MNRTSELKRTPFKRTMPTESKVRLRKCAIKTCRQPFQPRSMTHKCCSPDCAAEHVKLEREKKDRQERQKGLQALKSRKDWEREAQQAINAYVKWRDRELNCISCGQWFDGNYHAGHYLSRGARPNLALVENNIHKQCIKCNMHLSGNQAAMRIGLVAKIGVEAVEALESDHTPRKYTIEELKALRDHYRAKLKELKKGQS